MRKTAAAISAATALNLPFGTLYAFSVFLKPVETLLGVGRAEMSFVFALATITLTVGMNIAPRFYRKGSPVVDRAWLRHLQRCGPAPRRGRR